MAGSIQCMGKQFMLLLCLGPALTNEDVHCMSGKSIPTPLRLCRGLQIRNCVCVRPTAGVPRPTLEVDDDLHLC